MSEIANIDCTGSGSLQTITRLIDEGKEDQALDRLHLFLQETPDDPGLLNTLGAIYARREEFVKADSILSRVIGLDPEYADGYYNLGLLYSRQNRKSDAVENFLQVLKINPGHYAAHNDLGVIYRSRGKTDLGKQHFIDALEANPLYKDALINLFKICWDEGAYSEGLNWIEKFLRAMSNDHQLPAVDNTVSPVMERTTMQQSAIPDTSLSQSGYEKNSDLKEKTTIGR